MPHGTSRNVFLVVAGGNPAAERHFEDTIQRKRTLDEVRRFLPTQEIENLEKIYHSSNFIVWGAVPGPMNESRWEKMMPGDVVLIYNNGRIRFAGEIAAKVRNAELARYFWRENDAGGTWELMYFIVNEERTDVPIEKLNPLFGYQTSMIGLCQEGKSSPDALRRSAGAISFCFFAACVGLSASVPHDGEPDFHLLSRTSKWS